ncbi:hypothetical protein Plhal304r1_c003g0011221 [Plasmopara halstedii]
MRQKSQMIFYSTSECTPTSGTMISSSAVTQFAKQWARMLPLNVPTMLKAKSAHRRLLGVHTLQLQQCLYC